MKSLTPQLVIFDLDGTLIDSAADLGRAINAMLGEYGGKPLPIAETRAMVGDGARMLVKRALAASGLADVDEERAVSRFLAIYSADPVRDTMLYPGVMETLRELHKRGIAQAVCTNKPEGISRSILGHFDLIPIFETVVGGDTFAWRKPDPRVLGPVLRGRAPRHCLLVGDSEIDAATAEAAGMDFALFTKGYRRGPVEEIRSTFVLDQMDKLLAAILC